MVYIFTFENYKLCIYAYNFDKDEITQIASLDTDASTAEFRSDICVGFIDGELYFRPGSGLLAKYNIKEKKSTIINIDGIPGVTAVYKENGVIYAVYGKDIYIVETRTKTNNTLPNNASEIVASNDRLYIVDSISNEELSIYIYDHLHNGRKFDTKFYGYTVKDLAPSYDKDILGVSFENTNTDKPIFIMLAKKLYMEGE